MRGTPPSRPLGNAYWWILEADAAYLQYNYGCVAYVVRINGRLTTIIRWQGRTHEARCGSVAQGMRWIERWIEKRSGFPAKRPERWYDRVQRDRRQDGLFSPGIAPPGRAPYHARPSGMRTGSVR